MKTYSKKLDNIGRTGARESATYWYTSCDDTERGEAVDFYARHDCVPVLHRIGADRWAMSWEKKHLVAGMKKAIRANREYFIAED